MAAITFQTIAGAVAQWGSYMRAGDPGACFYSFQADGFLDSEAHRAQCLAWIDDHCRKAAARNLDPDSDNAELDAIRAYIVSARVRDPLDLPAHLDRNAQ